MRGKIGVLAHTRRAIGRIDRIIPLLCCLGLRRPRVREKAGHRHHKIRRKTIDSLLNALHGHGIALALSRHSIGKRGTRLRERIALHNAGDTVGACAVLVDRAYGAKFAPCLLLSLRLLLDWCELGTNGGEASQIGGSDTRLYRFSWR